ncbi:MAG TPA: M23 family metallopeptidase, partial [Acidiferrobacterales bacterium]|nr:M23 family metallopeptidase [Acidiferrobacterales bacterium]
MNIILIPRRLANGRHISLSTRQVWLLGLVFVVALPAFFGVVSYQIQTLLTVPAALRQPEYLQRQEQLLISERQALEAARRNAETHLNALAQRVGHLQAQLLRLNALGSRLVQRAGLDKREFNFAEEPAVGGPEAAQALRTTVPDFLQTLDTLSRQLEVKSERLEQVETVLLDRQLQAAVTPLGWPVEGGWVSSGFGLRADPFTGQRMLHEGVDIANRMGSPIYAMGGGLVTHAGPKTGYGLLVEINHGNGQSTRYAHAKTLLVKAGDKVDKGQAIALVGSSGRSTGAHVHFEVLQNGLAVNPASYLRQAAKP